MVIVTSDDPEALSYVEIDVEQDGTRRFHNEYHVPDELELPTTIAVVSNGQPTTQVTLKIVAWQDSEKKVPLDRRDAIVTQIPNDRVTKLTVVLSSRCSSKVTVNRDGEVESSCASGQTCDGKGECKSAEVKASSLPSYVPGAENDPSVSDTFAMGGSGVVASAQGGTSGQSGVSGKSGSGGKRDLVTEAGAAGEMGLAGEGGFGGEAGDATGDPCRGVVCDAQPSNECLGSSQLRTYDKIGSCSNGTCSYQSHDSSCDCQGGQCDPCSGVICNTPPSAICKDENKLTSYASSGTCAGGTCTYESTDGGCSSPPAQKCKDELTLTSYAASGTCASGSCNYETTDAACAFGCTAGVCKPDPCASKTCNEQKADICKNSTTKTTYAAGKCKIGTVAPDVGVPYCDYAASDTACESNKQCAGAGVCSVCKSDTACGASCAACPSTIPKCKDLSTTSQCVRCLSDNDCSGATPRCNTSTNTCVSRSCVGLAATCGPSGTADCCSSNPVPAGTFYRSYDGATYTSQAYPATVSDFRLDTYEVTVARFRKFMAAYSQTIIAAGSGKNPNNPNDPGWDTAWNASLPATATALATALKCDSSRATWTDAVGTAAAESLPINCITWFQAEAFCIWDGGRLPTEAEWNYAASGALDQRLYPWGNVQPDCSYANFSGAGAGGCALNARRVGSSSPKGDGKFLQSDLAGNVYEWVQDWFTSTYVKPCTDCAYLTAATSRVVRGGSFDSSPIVSSYRRSDSPSIVYFDYGVRCARAK